MKNKYKYLILASSLIFIIIGILSNQHSTVLQRAINVCLECVGIG